MYDTTDGVVLLMASERKFWRNFCDAIDRPDIFDANPGAEYADHARGNQALRAVLRDVFGSRTTADWVTLGIDHDVPIAPVNTPQTISDDPQFQDRLPWTRPTGPASQTDGADLLPSPIRVVGRAPFPLRRAPDSGDHTDEVLTDLLHYTPDQIATLRSTGALG
jgi:crotonobetainyl-CoA:carnitine CoA-transferase CaiB-like acyl-CoA transferase